MAALILTLLEQAPELVAWEILLILLLVILFRILPGSDEPAATPLFRRNRPESPRPPRAITSFELAASQAMTESPGADQRLKTLMRRIADHRLSRSDSPAHTRPSPDQQVGDSLVPLLFTESRQPLTANQIEDLIDELETL